MLLNSGLRPCERHPRSHSLECRRQDLNLGPPVSEDDFPSTCCASSFDQKNIRTLECGLCPWVSVLVRSQFFPCPSISSHPFPVHLTLSCSLPYPGSVARWSFPLCVSVPSLCRQVSSLLPVPHLPLSVSSSGAATSQIPTAWPLASMLGMRASTEPPESNPPALMDL